jgi:glucose-1-phosphate thymidylyltransferase
VRKSSFEDFNFGEVMKGIILAAGRSTRLYPLTMSFSKHFLPIFDKPMIYYPLSVLMLAGIREILIILNPSEKEMFEKLLGDGSRIGITITYMLQLEPRGIADAFIIGEKFIGNDEVCLILGDNVFYGQDFTKILVNAQTFKNKAVIFGYHVGNPSNFGVVEFNNKFEVLSLEEKPSKPKSSFAIPGLYFYPNSVVEIAKLIKPSSRGEIEITSINNSYYDKDELIAIPMGRGIAWLDTGNPEDLNKASNFVEIIQKRQGFYIGCIEEIAWRRNFITTEDLFLLGQKLQHTEYGKYLLKLCDGGRQ